MWRFIECFQFAKIKDSYVYLFFCSLNYLILWAHVGLPGLVELRLCEAFVFESV